MIVMVSKLTATTFSLAACQVEAVWLEAAVTGNGKTRGRERRVLIFS